MLPTASLSLARLSLGFGLIRLSSKKLSSQLCSTTCNYTTFPVATPTTSFLCNDKNKPLVFISSRSFAARKGTRTRKEKKKVKKEEVKKVFMFKNVRKEMEQTYKKQRPFDDSHYSKPVDNVFFTYKFQSIHYPFAEAIQNLKEANDPTMMNLPNAPLSLKINIDLTYPNRPNKFQDGWRSVIEMKAPFILEGMIRPSVLAFCPEDSDYIAGVLKAGADVAGSKEIIKAIQEGEISAKDYEYIIAHPAIVPDLSAIRGLIKKTFPTVKNKTISTDLVQEVIRLKSGVKIKLEKNDREPDYGYFEIPIGTLNMTIEQLESNFLSVLRDTVPRRVSGKDPEKFVISCIIRAVHEGRPREHFKIDLSPYMEEFRKQQKRKGEEEKEQDVEVETEEDEGTKKSAAAVAGV